MIEAGSTRGYPNIKFVRANLEMDHMRVVRNGVTYRAKGRCMYPTIRAGDVLRVQSCAAANVSIGDIAVFRRINYLFAHRVIEKGAIEDRAYILTRPDGVREGTDGRTFDETLVGIVSSIERKGKPAPLQPVVYPLLVRRYFDLRLALMHLAWLWLSWWPDALTRVQDSPLYRCIAGLWLILMRPRIKYTVRLPVDVLDNNVYRPVAPENFDLRKDWRGRPIERWILTIHMNGQRDPAASITMLKTAAKTWSVADSFFQPRYRGMDLVRVLMRQVEIILRRNHVSQHLDVQSEGGLSSYPSVQGSHVGLTEE
jgi:hypothetical protein